MKIYYRKHNDRFGDYYTAHLYRNLYKKILFFIWMFLMIAPWAAVAYFIYQSSH